MIFAEFELSCGNLKFIGRDWAEASIPFVAAHDLFEHAEDDTGTLEEELMALGAGIFLRIGLNPDPDYNASLIAGDVNQVTREYLTTAFKKPDLKLSGPLPLELEDLFSVVVSKVYFNRTNAHVEDILSWVRIGLFRAYIKFNSRIDMIRNLYNKVFETFRKYSKDNRYGTGIVRVIIDLDNGSFDHECEITA